MTDISVSSVESAKQLVALHQTLRANAGQFAIFNQLLDIGFPVRQVNYFGIEGSIPNWFVADLTNSLLVMVDGISTVFQGAGLFSSLALPLDGVGSWKANTMMLADAKAIVAMLNTLYSIAGRRVVFSGYSYGGSLVEIASAIMQVETFPVDLGVVTFGSPRAGDLGLCRALVSVALRRWMNDNDPVPRFPFHAAEAPIGTLALPYTTAYNCSLYSQPYGGVMLRPDGTAVAASLPDLFVPVIDVDLLGWATGLNGVKSRAHSLLEYRARLNALGEASTSQVGKVSGGGFPESPTTLSFGEFTALTAVVGAINLALSHSGGSMAYIPVTYRANVVRLTNNYYAVVWCGVAVATCANKSNARTTAKWLNKWLRVILEDASVNVVGLASAFSTYWAAAALGTGGFLPPQVTH